MDPATIIILTGPTATGKSALAVRLARQLDGEVLSADSQQVYRGCDVGTGKLPVAARGNIPHHGLDLVAPDAAFDAYQYLQYADRVIQDIAARGHVPIVVGGTGLYLRALIWGFCDVPPRDATLRTSLERRLAAEGSAALHAELASCDPELAAEIHPQHSTRIIRALEVYRLTGQSIRAFQAVHRCQDPRYRAHWLGLDGERAVVRARIAERIAQQVAAGWLEEVRQLRDRYGPDIAIFRALGYRALLAAGTVSDTTVQHIITATTQYAKRQRTYLRAIPDITWFNVVDPEYRNGIEDLLCRTLNRSSPARSSIPVATQR